MRDTKSQSFQVFNQGLWWFLNYCSQFLCYFDDHCSVTDRIGLASVLLRLRHCFGCQTDRHMNAWHWVLLSHNLLPSSAHSCSWSVKVETVTLVSNIYLYSKSCNSYMHVPVWDIPYKVFIYHHHYHYHRHHSSKSSVSSILYFTTALLFPIRETDYNRMSDAKDIEEIVSASAHVRLVSWPGTWELLSQLVSYAYVKYPHCVIEGFFYPIFPSYAK
jgi:hypothetical protein